MSTMPESDGLLPDPTFVSRAEVVVADMERALGFYAGLLGLDAVADGAGGVRLSAGGPPLLILRGRPDAVPAPRRAAGLYHNAFRVPSRTDLGRVLLRLAAAAGVRLGAGDHGVSEALYLEDPEGNGVEVYADRPRETWPVERGRMRMGTAPVDLRGLAAQGRPLGPAGLPAGTRLGHIHLKVTDLPRSLAFYRRLGLALMQEIPGSAAFLSAGGYHHHLGINTWESSGGSPRLPGRLGLARFRLAVPVVADVRGAAWRLGLPEPPGRELLASDPDGIELTLAVE